MVAGRYKIYIVYTFVLKSQHNVPQFLNAYLLAAFSAAYFVGLAEHTAQVAAGEEQCT